LLVSLFWAAAQAFPPNVPLGGLPGGMLRTGYGAEGQGMGNATVALSDAVAGMQANPALLALSPQRVLHLGGSLLSLDRREGFAMFMQPIRPKAAIGFAWLYRGDPEFEIIDADETVAGTSSESFNAARVGLAYRPRRTLSLGATLGFFYHRVHEFNSSSVGLLDLGAYWQATRALSAGLAVKNLPILSGKIPWQVPTGTDWNAVADFSLPYHAKLGACYKGLFRNHDYRVALEENLFFWQSASDRWLWTHSQHAGVEAWVTPRFAVRTGYDRGRFPLGFGISDILKGLDFDYSFAFERNGMGLNHTVEWQWDF